MFKALVLQEAHGRVQAAVEELSETQLPDGDVDIAVEYSSLNYKDGMILKGLGRLVHQYPHVPGIDLAGTVIESRHRSFHTGDRVVLTGWRVGERHWGGYAQKARVQGEWLLPLPENLTARRAMAIGTAGLAAMLAVMALEKHGLTPSAGEVLVTGATGGVGSLAVMMLAQRGYHVVAVTGRPALHGYLKSLGASEIIARAELAQPPSKPLESERWAGCIDAVGGAMLARALAQMRYGSSVAAVGLAGGNKLETTVLPFLLRGVNLLGIDSSQCPNARRQQIWAELARALPAEKLDAITTVARLQELPRLADDILLGRVRGRVVVDVSA